jgi:hypothetical protein
MTRQKIGSENIRKISSVGGASFSITIPIEYMRELKWREKQKVVVKKRGKKLTIEDWKK